jgi:tRNA G18 (ribose-2'-O)-methylase SpoU
MTLIRIDDPRDPRLADYAGVAQPRLLSDRGLLIAEGRFVVGRLLDAGRITVRSLLLNEAGFRALTPHLNGREPRIDVYVAPPEVITAAAGFNMHRGCLALAERPPEHAMAALLETSQVVVALERVVDADNIGSVFRNAEAFGADAVVLSPGCCDPLYRKAIRTSSAATLVVPYAAASPWPDALDRLTAAGFTIAAMTPDAGATEIGEFIGTLGPGARVAVLLGTEGHGLTANALLGADVRVRIPMHGTLDSLNVATAAGIVLHRVFEMRRRR